jgi:hypothetical protein
VVYDSCNRDMGWHHIFLIVKLHWNIAKTRFIHTNEICKSLGPNPIGSAKCSILWKNHATIFLISIKSTIIIFSYCF